MLEPTDKPAHPLPPPYFESPDRRFRLYQGDCLELMPLMPAETFDLIFADPPYFLSNNGITCHAGKMVSVNKGKWDQSKGAEADHEFTLRWLAECRRLLKPHGSIWVSGTMHIVHSMGYAMQRLGYKLLNDITWVKPNPPPNLSCRYFTHATETLLWAGRDKKCRHKFNYALMKRVNRGKQMKSVWEIEAPRREEKVFGKHPTQKPVALLERIIAAASDENDLVLDPFSGSATTGIAAARLGRAYAGVEREPLFLHISECRFNGVPQADSPDRILALVRGHADGCPGPEQLAATLGLSERQVHYYRQAASLLGFISRSGGEWQLSEPGRALTCADAAQARVILAHTMLAVPLVSLAASRARAHKYSGPRLEAVARLLRGASALGESTCLRRAQTLLAWIAWTQECLEAKARLPFDQVPAAPEEAEDAAVA